MAKSVLVTFSDETLRRLDTILAQKIAAEGSEGLRSLTSKQVAEANAVLKKSGSKAADKYFASLDRRKTRTKNISRMKIVIQLVELGLRHYEADGGPAKRAEKKAAPPPRSSKKEESPDDRQGRFCF